MQFMPPYLFYISRTKRLGYGLDDRVSFPEVDGILSLHGRV